jgi:hypothetical protein
MIQGYRIRDYGRTSNRVTGYRGGKEVERKERSVGVPKERGRID